jgi:alpha-beta hydrolase superfamily lysophospholipase
MKIGRIILALLVIVVARVLWTAQNWFYYPTRETIREHPGAVALNYTNLTFSSTDGTKLHGWFLPAQGESKGVVLHVHGNTGCLRNHFVQFEWLPIEGYSVLAFDYRGYGLSENRQPTPKGLMRDTQGAIAFLKTFPATAGQKLLILAQSIGGNNAIAAVAHSNKEGIAGIVLDATFFSYSAVASYHVPKAGILMSDRYSANRLIKQLAPIPLLFLHGKSDPVVPWTHSRDLYELATSPKQITYVPGAGHMVLLPWGLSRKDVLNFFDDCLKGQKE